MSLASFVAKIQLPATLANGNTSGAAILPFSIARTNIGTVLDRTVVELEELTTPGVDGRRWRQLRTFFPEFTMETWADYSSYPLAIADRRNYQLAQGQFVTLNWTAATYSANYFKVKVLDVQAVTMAGVMGGYGADASSAALIRANWVLCVQAIENAQPQP